MGSAESGSVLSGEDARVPCSSLEEILDSVRPRSDLVETDLLTLDGATKARLSLADGTRCALGRWWRSMVLVLIDGTDVAFSHSKLAAVQ